MKHITKNTDSLDDKIRKYKLGAMDKLILDKIKDRSITQADLCSELKRSRSTISRHLHLLGVLSLIKTEPSYPVLYKLNNKLEEQLDQDILTAVTLHNIRTRCDILKGQITDDDIQPYIKNGYKEVPMKGWTKKIFKINNMKIQLNSDNSLEWWCEGIGYDPDDKQKAAQLAETNLKDTSHDIRKFLERKFNCELSSPRFFRGYKDEKHWVEVIVNSTEEVDRISKFWVDKSHPDNPETSDVSVLGTMTNLFPEVKNIKDRVKSLENNSGHSAAPNEIVKMLDEKNKEIDEKLQSGFNTLTKMLDNNDRKYESELLKTRTEIINLKEVLADFITKFTQAFTT